MVTRTSNTVSTMSYKDLRIIRVDGADDVTLDVVYKDMSVADLKRDITAMLRRPAYMWEDFGLYHLGVVMRNDQSLSHYALYNGAIIRYSLETYQPPQHRNRSISITSPTNDLFIFDSCLSTKFCEDELRTILSLDGGQSRTLLGMPSAKMFVDIVLGRRAGVRVS